MLGLTKEHAKTFGIVLVAGLAALAIHQRFISPMLVVKTPTAPKVA